MMLRFPKPCRRGRKPRKPIRRNRQPRALSEYGIKRQLADDLSSIACRAEHALGVRSLTNRRNCAFRSGCELCGREQGDPARLQWAHGITRARLAIRYHADNTFALCAACHMRYTYHLAHEWPAVHAALVGPAAYQHVLAANSGKRNTVDLDLVIIDAGQRITKLPAGEVREWALERLRAARAAYDRRCR